MFLTNPPPNKSFDRSANSAALIRETCVVDALCARPVNSSVRRTGVTRRGGVWYLGVELKDA